MHQFKQTNQSQKLHLKYWTLVKYFYDGLASQEYPQEHRQILNLPLPEDLEKGWYPFYFHLDTWLEDLLNVVSFWSV